MSHETQPASPYDGLVSTLEHSDDPHVQILSPNQALKRARPLPKRQDLIISDVPDVEWTAFLEALADT
jgi:hypothetical protein